MSTPTGRTRNQPTTFHTQMERHWLTNFNMSNHIPILQTPIENEGHQLVSNEGNMYLHFIDSTSGEKTKS